MVVHIRAAIAAGVALTVLASPFTASSSTIVFGNGFAHACSVQAIDGKFTNDALKVCDQAIDEEFLKRDDLAKTLVNRGVVHMRRKNLDGAGRDFARAEAVMPGLPEIYINRAVVLIKQGKFQEAVGQADKGIALKPDELEKAYFNRGLAREAAGDVRGAYLDYSKALELKPGWEPPQKELVRFQVQRG